MSTARSSNPMALEADQFDHSPVAPRASDPPRRVLIVLSGSIGDVVRALPLLGRIRRAWPAAYIAWTIEPKSRPILEGHPWLDELITYDRRRPWSFPFFLARVRAGRFDLVLDLQRHLKSGLVSLASGAPDRIGFAAGNSKEGNCRFSTRQIAPQPPMRLKLLQYQAFGDLLGLAPAPVEFGLAPSASERELAARMLADAPRPLLGVILGSSWPSRIWPPEAIAEAVRILAEPAGNAPALFPVLLGGGEETDLAGRTFASIPGGRCLNLAGRTHLRDLPAIFESCAAAFGPDSGPMHIAAAVGCPVVSLWGSTSPQRSAPWGFADLTITGEIPCHPCYLRKCPIGGECMRRIAPADVAAMVRRACTANAKADRRSAIAK
jgi:heptosyltransferase-1